MFEFRWETPPPHRHEVMLRVHSKRGWMGRKVVTVDGKVVVRRGRFQGVFSRFPDPDTGERLELRLLPVENSPVWRPALFRGGQELPQTGGTPPPRIITPPRLIAMSAAVVYVAILMVAVSLLPITEILNALYLNHDDHRYVIRIDDPAAATETLRVDTVQFPPIKVGQEFHGRLEAHGGQPPYTWKREVRGWPKGITLDEKTGALSGVPELGRDFSGQVKVKDASGAQAGGAFAVHVDPITPPPPGTLLLTTTQLPSATRDRAYSFQLTATGGRPTPGTDKVEYRWSALGKRGLPKGLRLDEKTGRLHGTPAKAGGKPVVLRVADQSYAASHSIEPWIIPVILTAICLIGFLQMRRGSVPLYAVAIIAQAVALVMALVPISPIALGFQVPLWLIGAAHYKAMQ